MLLVHLLVGLEGPEVGFDEILLQILREAGAGLPDEGGYIVVDGTASAALEIYEPGIPVLDHHVAGLEVPVHKGVILFLQQIGLELLEIVLEENFIEFQAGGLEETVFEVVEVEVHHPGVEGLLRVAHLPVQPLCALELDLGQLLDGAPEDILLGRAVQAALPALGHHTEEHLVSQVFLEVRAFVLAHRVHGRHLEALFTEVAGNADETVVLFQVAADGADQRHVPALQTEVATVAARCGKLLDFRHFLAGIGFK